MKLAKSLQALRYGLVLPLAVAVVLLLTISAAWYLQRLADEASDLRELSSQRLLQLDRMLNNLRIAEAAQRGYLITGLARYLKPYEQGKAGATGHLAELTRRYASDATVAALLKRLARWHELRLEELDEGLVAQKTMGSEYARLLTVADSGRSYMQQIERIVADLQEREDSGNRALRELSVQRRRDTVAAGLALYLVSGAVGLVVFVSLRREARARQRLADQMEHDAFHDALTGLPNRRYFLEELCRSVNRVQRRSSTLGLLFIDLDGFKQVNDGLGHEAGDEVLKLATARFQQVVRQADLLARLGGDEFAVLFEVEDPRGDVLFAQRLLDALRPPLLEAHPEYVVGASIGIATYPADAGNAEQLLARADQAMYLAKRTGKNKACRNDETGQAP